MNELYHHGVKGMKWGVRRAREPQSARQFSAALNRNDQKLTVARYMYNTTRARHYRNAYRMANKLNTQNEKLSQKDNVSDKDLRKIQSRVERYNKKLGKYQKIDEINFQEYEKYAKRSQELLDRAAQKGYTVSSKDTDRIITASGGYMLTDKGKVYKVIDPNRQKKGIFK